MTSITVTHIYIYIYKLNYCPSIKGTGSESSDSLNKNFRRVEELVKQKFRVNSTFQDFILGETCTVGADFICH